MKQQPLIHPQVNWASNAADDLSALSQLVSLPELAYQDIGQQQQLAHIVERWSLLAELSLITDDGQHLFAKSEQR